MTTHELLYVLACLSLPITIGIYYLPALIKRARFERQCRDAEQWKRERL